jgi:hypothetical protein
MSQKALHNTIYPEIAGQTTTMLRMDDDKLDERLRYKAGS